MKKKTGSKKNIIIITLFASLLVSILATLFILPNIHSGKLSGTYYSEIEDLKDKHSFDEFKNYFEELSEKKGARYAFEVLRVAPVPPNTDMHLLGHAVGEMLYKQEGLNGIEACTNDFRNACSHSIVVGLFFDRGEAALGEIVDACRKAPGGSGAYTMCFHGLGHGILAAVGYNLEKTIQYCKKTGSIEYGNSEASQCMSGAVMEFISGGGHDRDIWAQQRKKYLNPKEPLSMCSKLIPQEGRYLCYVYITPFLFESVGADIGNPGTESFEKSFPICEKIAANDKSNRDACFGGFGKEFVGLVQSRDIRKDAIGNMTDEQFIQVYDWCKLANNKDGTAACITHAMNSLYWGGENDPKVAIGFCGVMADNNYNQGSCYMNLITSVSQYIKDIEYRKNFCNNLPSDYQRNCQQRLLGS